MRRPGRLALVLLALSGGPALADLAGHGGPVRGLALSPDGRTTVSGGFDYSLMVWDLASGAPVGRLLGHAASLTGVALTPDARHAVSVGDDGAVIAWDLAAGTTLWRIETEVQLAAVALAPDGTVAAAGWDGAVRLLRLADGSEVARLRIEGERVTAVAFTARGDLVAGGHLGTLRLWRRGDRALVRTWPAHPLGVTSLATAGELIATGSADRAVRLWDAGTGEPQGELSGHDRPVSAVALSADGVWLASAAIDGALVLWRVAEARAELVREAHDGPVWALAFRSDGRELLTAGADGVIRRWSIPEGERLGAAAASAAAGDPAGDGRGAALFRTCVACHTLTADGGNRAGPSLHGLFGRRAGSLPGYAYSPALKNSPIVWNEETVGRLFEIGPDAYTPGSKMPLQRMPSAADRAALIAYLKAATAPRAAASPKGEEEP